MTVDEQARARARRLYRSPGFQSAYLSGVQAATDGRAIELCPYADRGGWKAWRRAWLLGYRSESP